MNRERFNYRIGQDGVVEVLCPAPPPIPDLKSLASQVGSGTKRNALVREAHGHGLGIVTDLYGK